jgi:diaminohydroxyphosphoribosylaminopyrimidine deaminase/5-amino-6-(5-phosphoribosylamino)uracil reductase
VDSLLEVGLGRVVVGMLDVNPKVAGRGIGRLEEAGLPVEVGLFEQECRRLNEAYITWMMEKRPFVVLKVASSLDGKIATYRGQSRWISGEESRKRVHALRACVDAVMVGAATAVADDPELTVRMVEGDVRQPVRVVVDSTLRLPATARLLAEGSELKTVVATTAKAPQERRRAVEAMGRDVLVLPERQGRVDLSSLMARLAEMDVVSLLLEGGGELNASMVEEGLVDKVLVIIAPMLLGGGEAPTVLDGLGVGSIEEAWRLNELSFQKVGEDLHVEGYLERGA